MLTASYLTYSRILTLRGSDNSNVNMSKLKLDNKEKARLKFEAEQKALNQGRE